MKKRITAFLCALALSLSLAATRAGAEDLFFLALNDALPAASSQITPIQSGGWIYVPASVFNNRVSGVNFGVYYGFTDNNTLLTFYNLSGKTLTFDLTANTASTSTGETIMPGRPVWSGGTCYVPAYALCNFFGLTYSYTNTDYGPLLRIKDGNARLSDASFLSSAESLMRSRYNAAHPQQTTPEPAANPTPAAPAAPANNTTPASTPSSNSTKPAGSGGTARPSSPSSSAKPAADNTAKPADGSKDKTQEETPEPVKTFSLYLGLKANGDVTAALDALASVNATAIVFFPADKLDRYADQIRQAAGRGHRVGLAPAGDTPAQRLESAREGSEILARILRQETWFVLAQDRELADAGYLLWAPTATMPGGQDEAIYTGIYNAAAGKSGVTRLLAGTDQRLAPLLAHLARDGDSFLVPRETNY